MLYDDFLNQSRDTLKSFTDMKGVSTGLSPKTYSGLQSLALESVPAQFDKTEEELFTTLQRNNPAGLPMGGEYLRAYAPLEVAKEGKRADLLRDLMLEDESERRRTLDLNNQNALSAAGTMGGIGTNLFGQEQAQKQFDARLAFEGREGQLNRENAIKLAELNNAPASLKSLILSSLLSSAFAPNSALGGGSLVGKGVDALLGIFGGGGKGDYARIPIPPIVPDIGGGVAGGIAGIGDAGVAAAAGAPAAAGAAAGGGGISGALGAVGGGIKSGLSGVAGALGAIPLAGQIALGAGGAFLAAKKLFGLGNTHEKADDWVQHEQNGFDSDMAGISDELQSGAISQEQADSARMALLRDYVTTARQFAAKGKDQRRVIDQAFETLRANYQPFLDQFQIAAFIDVPQYIKAQGWF